MSLAKGPALVVGLVLLGYGVLAFVFGDATSFTARVPDGTVNGPTFLGPEVNGWSSLLFAGSGALLVFGAPMHWGAKGMSIIVGLVLGAAALIAVGDTDDVLGIFAANGLTILVWGAAAVVLLLVALLPRVGGDKHGKATPRERPVHQAKDSSDAAHDADASADEGAAREGRGASNRRAT